MAIFAGIDTGGTFTDLIAFDSETGRSFVHKTPSTPEDPARAILQGIADLIAANQLGTKPLSLVAHGTTVGTNALLQRRGGMAALVTTKGFRDLLEIGRQTRPLNFDIHLDHPPPVIPRPRRFEVAERCDWQGETLEALDEAALDSLIDQIRGSGANAVAICFLFSYLQPRHEQRAAALLRRRLPGVFVSLSSEVQPEFREYERFSTTCINAFLQPVMAAYLRDLGARFQDGEDVTRVVISRSNGGLMTLGTAADFPVRTALSGPAAGVTGATEILRRSAFKNAITFDMGGTSADIALIRDGSEGYRHENTFGGYPIRMPMVDIHTIGAGGGSIAWLDRDDLLKVGPRSAGAVPGPACYGKGGTEPTVSDANAVLGRLSSGLLGGQMPLDIEAARRVLRPLADHFGYSLERTARGVLDIVVANMVRAIRVVSVQRGFDPRRFALFAFGGAGPLHARDVAAALDIDTVVVPPFPGILCASGLLSSRFKEDFVRTVRQVVSSEDDLTKLLAAVGDLLAASQDWADAEALEDYTAAVYFDMRYLGQNFESLVPIGAVGRNGRVPSVTVDALRTRFFAAHEREYGFHAEDIVEVVNIRLASEGSKLRFDAVLPDAFTEMPSGVTRRPVWFDADGPVEAIVLNRRSLPAGFAGVGPAVIDQLDTTTLIYPGDSFVIDANHNLIVSLDHAG